MYFSTSIKKRTPRHKKRVFLHDKKELLSSEEVEKHLALKQRLNKGVFLLELRANNGQTTENLLKRTKREQRKIRKKGAIYLC